MFNEFFGMLYIRRFKGIILFIFESFEESLDLQLKLLLKRKIKRLFSF